MQSLPQLLTCNIPLNFVEHCENSAVLCKYE